MTLHEALRVLGVDRSATADQARRAYLRLVKKHRPESDPEGFRRLREAYEFAESWLKLDEADEEFGAAPLAVPAPGAVAASEQEARSPLGSSAKDEAFGERREDGEGDQQVADDAPDEGGREDAALKDGAGHPTQGAGPDAGRTHKRLFVASLATGDLQGAGRHAYGALHENADMAGEGSRLFGLIFALDAEGFQSGASLLFGELSAYFERGGNELATIEDARLHWHLLKDYFRARKAMGVEARRLVAHSCRSLDWSRAAAVWRQAGADKSIPRRARREAIVALMTRSPALAEVLEVQMEDSGFVVPGVVVAVLFGIILLGATCTRMATHNVAAEQRYQARLGELRREREAQQRPQGARIEETHAVGKATPEAEPTPSLPPSGDEEPLVLAHRGFARALKEGKCQRVKEASEALLTQWNHYQYWGYSTKESGITLTDISSAKEQVASICKDHEPPHNRH